MQGVRLQTTLTVKHFLEIIFYAPLCCVSVINIQFAAVGTFLR